jgi:hypothetical protein
VSLIDQRIFIEASVDAIWSYISDPALIPKWNRTCKQISVLSTKPMGLHSRRRYMTETGRSMVEEITAWFEHLGFEAVQIDGPYHSFKSRFRLQAIPEGTIVNWSVEYRLKGPMGGLRDAASLKRQQQELMADSLRRLKRLLDTSGVRFDPEVHARFAMQSAPSPESRAARAPVQASGDGITEQRAALKPVAMDEDDVPDLPVPAYSAELSDTTSAPITNKDDTKPRTPKGLREALASRRKETVELKDETGDQEAVDGSASTVPISMVAPPPAPQPDTETLEVVTPPPRPPNPLAPPDTLPERIPTGPMPAFQNVPSAETNGEKRDTKEASIWDVFGVERPSEKAQSELSAVIASIQPKAEPVVEEQATEAVPQLQMAAPMTVTPVRPLRKRHSPKVIVPVRRARG